jgi:hypothetical protein
MVVVLLVCVRCLVLGAWCLVLDTSRSADVGHGLRVSGLSCPSTIPKEFSTWLSQALSFRSVLSAWYGRAGVSLTTLVLVSTRGGLVSARPVHRSSGLRASISEACAQVEWPAGWYQRGRCVYPPVVCRYQPAPGTCPLTSVQVSATSAHMADACAQVSTRAGHMSNDRRARISDLGACGRDLRAGIRDLRAQVR